MAIKNKEFIITSNRKKERIIYHNFLIQIHLLLTFLFTTKWISFGNSSTFNSKNLKLFFRIHFTHIPAQFYKTVILNVYMCERFFDKSKLGILVLIDHSL